MIRKHWRLVLLSIASGIVGVLLTLGAVHLYQDHETYHQVVAWVVSVQQAQVKQQAAQPQK